MENSDSLPETGKEELPSSPGIHLINVETQCEDLFVLDKKIADESDGLLLPLQSAEIMKRFLIEEHNTKSMVLNDSSGEHIGFFPYYDVDSHTSELLTIGVLKSFQGKGYAQAMMQKYFELNPDKKKFILVTKPQNLRAIRFYEKLGYKIKALKKDYYGSGEDRVLLELNKKDK